MWECVEIPQAVHSMPLDDLFEHILDYTCDCKPVVYVVDETLVNYQHKAFDKREHSEPDHEKERCAYCVAYS